MKFIFLLIFMVTHSFANELPLEEEVKEIKQKVSGTSFYREHAHHTALVGYEFLTTWLPLKYSLSYTYIFNKEWSLEAGYGRGHFGLGMFGFDVASVSENRFTLLARRYTGNSFHWIFGLYKNDLRAKLGSDILDGMTDTSIDPLTVNVIGATVGFGNRWQWQKGFTLGIDWARVNLPIFSHQSDGGALNKINDGSDYDSVKNGLNRVERWPSFTLLGIYLGYTF